MKNRRRYTTLGRAYTIAELFKETLQQALGSSAELAVAGGVRRYEPLVRNLDFVGVATTPDLMDRLVGVGVVGRVLHQSPAHATVLVENEQIDVRLVDRDSYATALAHYTGSRAHNQLLHEWALKRGWLLSAEALCDTKTGARTEIETEEALYSALSLPCIPPELRNGTDELAVAESGMPLLVDRTHIRGDLHVHTDWSDGRDPIDVMVAAARDLGYEYVAITDHSPSAGASRVLTASALIEQIAAIDEARQRVPGIAVLHGIEVDILPDGGLDLADELLSKLDIVLASLHFSGGQTRQQLTERYIRAMQHPLVSIITHPTNRLVGHREGYDLDWPLLFRTAVDTGTILEIDGAPSHLDMDGLMARAAIEAGVTVSIDSDCHRGDALGRQMEFGVAMARRGWVEPRHVLNTRPLAEVREFIGRKRRGT